MRYHIGHIDGREILAVLQRITDDDNKNKQVKIFKKRFVDSIATLSIQDMEKSFGYRVTSKRSMPILVGPRAFMGIKCWWHFKPE